MGMLLRGVFLRHRKEMKAKACPHNSECIHSRLWVGSRHTYKMRWGGCGWRSSKGINCPSFHWASVAPLQIFQPALFWGSCASKRATGWDGIVPWAWNTLGLRRSRFSSPSYPDLHSSRVPLITSAPLAETWPEPWSNLRTLGTIGGFYHGNILSSGCLCPLAGVLVYWNCMKEDEGLHEGIRKAQISIPKNNLHWQCCTIAEWRPCSWVWRGMKIKHHHRHGVLQPWGVLLPLHMHRVLFWSSIQGCYQLNNKTKYRKESLLQGIFSPLISSVFPFFPL